MDVPQCQETQILIRVEIDSGKFNVRHIQYTVDADKYKIIIEKLVFPVGICN